MPTKRIISSEDKLFTSNRYVREFYYLAESIGFKKEDFAKQIGLSIRSIEDPQVIISKNYIFKGYQLLLEYADDELLGATLGSLPRSSVELMVKSASMEPTLKHALRSIEQVFYISQNAAGSKIVIEDKFVRWQFSPQVKEERFRSLIATLCIYMMRELVSLLIKKELVLNFVNLKELNSNHTSDYQFLYNCPLKFGQACDEIVFDKSWLNEPIKCEFEKIKPYLKVPLALTNHLTENLGTTELIRNILAASPYSQFPSQEQLAQQLGMSIRTIQRKLAEQNICHTQLKDDVRQRKALYYLVHTQKSFDEIANRCGFSELASFCRAFKRWTGYSPAKYKKKNVKKMVD